MPLTRNPRGLGWSGTFPRKLLGPTETAHERHGTPSPGRYAAPIPRGRTLKEVT